MKFFNDILGAARNTPRVVGRAVKDLAPRDEPGGEDVPGPAEVGETLRSVDARLGPIHHEIRSLDESAGRLRAELETSREEIGALNETARALNESMGRLSGEIEHLLDRVPGLSPERARERAAEIASDE
ncbi:hypothetical protein HJD18_03970 [Thermoleophilia bacterium SCSIO 60948]|nr:hypothetical protein HJD18_03970 [Thermoleophilia bacterium SCSIO 60948]